MKPVNGKSEHIIEFRKVDGGDMLGGIKQLFIEYAQSLGIDLAFQGFDKELESLPGKYASPDGVLILASVEGKAAGCIALRKLSEEICEMKRLYVRDAYRGLGIGKQLIELLIKEAESLNYRYIRLDTLPAMKDAQRLYLSYGFYDIEPYVYNPIEGARFMELKLGR